MPEFLAGVPEFAVDGGGVWSEGLVSDFGAAAGDIDFGTASPIDKHGKSKLLINFI